MQASSVSLGFALVVLGWLAVRLWLASRQVQHVARHRDEVPPAFAATVTLAAHQRAADYTIAKARLGVLAMAWGAAVLLGWTLLGGLDLLNTALRDALQHRFGPMAYQLALLAAFTLIAGALELPFDLYNTFRLEQRFGFNRMTPRLWLSDLFKGVLVGALIGLPVAALLLWIMGSAGPWWWLWAWGAWMAFNLLLLMIYPMFIAPLFNKFQPLEDESLKARVTALMQRCGFAAQGLYVMDGSRRSAHGNAYFTGFGAARRVVFFDTLLRQLDTTEIEAVLAHELGHFRRRHILKRVLLMFGLSLLGFALLGWLATQTWFYAGLGVTPNLGAAFGAPNDALALLLFALVLPVFSFFVTPLWSQLSRRHEFEADAFAVEQTSAHSLSSALLKLYEDNASTLTPDPLYVKVYYSHPSAAERLARLAG